VPAAGYLLLLIVAVAAAVAQSVILNQWDWRQFFAYVIAYTLLLLLPPAIVKWLRGE
jgi:sugar phosphate permease